MGETLQDIVIESKALRKSLKAMADKDDAVYPRYRTEMFFRIFWVIAVAVIFYTNYSLLPSASLTSHIATFIAAIIGVKVWDMIPAYMDLCEDVGLIIPEHRIESQEVEE